MLVLRSELCVVPRETLKLFPESSFVDAVLLLNPSLLIDKQPMFHVKHRS